MPTLSKVERIVYNAKNNRSGLTDVALYLAKPDGSIAGPFALAEYIPLQFKGLYYFDLTTSLSDLEGEWVVSIVSPTESVRTPYKLRFDAPNAPIVSSSSGILIFDDVIGFVDPTIDIVGEIDLSSDIVGFIDESSDMLGSIDTNFDLTGLVDQPSDLTGEIDCL